MIEFVFLVTLNFMSQTINLGNLRNVRDDTYSFNNESKPSDTITFSTPFENQSTYNMRVTNKPYQKYNGTKVNSINPVDLASKYSAPDDDLMVDLSNYNNKEVLDYQSNAKSDSKSDIKSNGRCNDAKFFESDSNRVKQQIQLLQQNFKRQVSNYLTNAKHIKNSALRSINHQLVEIQHKIKDIIQDINENDLVDVQDNISKVKSKLNNVKSQIMKNINREYFNSSPYVGQWSSSGRIQDNIEGFKSKHLKSDSSSTFSTVISVIVIIVLIILIVCFGYYLYTNMGSKTIGGTKPNSKQIYPIPVKTSIKYDSNGKVIPISSYKSAKYNKFNDSNRVKFSKSSFKPIDKRYSDNPLYSDHKSQDRFMEQIKGTKPETKFSEPGSSAKPSVESTKLSDSDKKVLESFGGTIDV